MRFNTFLCSVFIVAWLLAMPLCLAETYPVATPVSLTFVCTIDDSIPSSSATYNFSIFYPNGTTLISNNEATAKGQGTFNYTTTFPVIGIYKVTSYCYDGANSYSSNEEVNITPNGTQLSTSQGIIYFLFLIAALTIFFVCLYYAIKLEWANNKDEEGNVIAVSDWKYVKLFMICMSYVLLLLIFGLLRGITANYVPEVGVSGFFEIGYWLMLSAMYPLIVASLILALIVWFNDKKFRDALNRGFAIQ